MKTDLNFEQTETKEMLSKYNFEYFLKKNISEEGYNQSDIDSIYKSFTRLSSDFSQKEKNNKKQFNFYAEGQVRKMFTGGFLPALFELDESRGQTFIVFSEVGENWAYFEHWQKYQRYKITKRKVWEFVIKLGSILAILLSMIKLIELLN